MKMVFVMNWKSSLLAVGMAALLASCTVGPKYSKPSVPTAPAYSEQPPSGDGWQNAKPSDAVLRGNWWELFGDPALTALEAQVEPSNQTLQVAEANFRQAQAAIKYNRSFLYPTIGVNPSIGRDRISGNSPTGLQGYQYGNFALPLGVSYEPDLWGRVRRSIASAREQFQASAGDLENVKLELHTELALDYYDARGLDAQKQLLDDTVVAYTRALELTQNRYNGGIANKAEVAQAKTQLDQTQAQDMDVSVARSQAEHAIAVLVGQHPEGFHLPGNPLKQEPPAIPIGMPSQLLERRPDIAAAERRMAAANEQIGIARTAFFPELLISATGGLQSGSIVDWFTWPSRYWAVGPQMIQTIFDAGQRRAQVQIAQAAYEATIGNYRQTALTAFQNP
jgi:NodT family efflux transporter outer membrane factor (OMF) lipoprotein